MAGAGMGGRVTWATRRTTWPEHAHLLTPSPLLPPSLVLSLQCVLVNTWLLVEDARTSYTGLRWLFD